MAAGWAQLSQDLSLGAARSCAKLQLVFLPSVILEVGLVRILSPLRLLALSLVLLGVCALGMGSLAQTRTAEATRVQVLPLIGAIGPATAAFITGALEDAASEADLVVIEMDTPGGLVDAMREINQAILNSSTPVIVYVSPAGARATSAGTYILYASHIAAMAPGSTVGAATPVNLGPATPSTPTRTPPATPPATPGEGDTSPQSDQPAADNAQAMRNKAVNDSVAAIRSLAELRGRNADWAERAVRDGVSLTANEALAQDVIEFYAEDLDTLLTQIDGYEVSLAGGERLTLSTAATSIERIEPGFALQFLTIITNPNIAFLLINIGFIGLLASFYNGLEPVTLIAGLVCLIIGFYGLNTLPVNYAGAALIIIGLGMLIAEAFITAYGLLALSGIAIFVFGALMLVDSDIEGLRIDWRLVTGMGLGMGALTLAIVSYGLAAQTRKVTTGREGLIGMTGEVLEWEGSRGFVHVDGERWAARSKDTLEVGDSIKVSAINGLELTVKKLNGNAR